LDNTDYNDAALEAVIFKVIFLSRPTQESRGASKWPAGIGLLCVQSINATIREKQRLDQFASPAYQKARNQWEARAADVKRANSRTRLVSSSCAVQLLHSGKLFLLLH